MVTEVKLCGHAALVSSYPFRLYISRNSFRLLSSQKAGRKEQPGYTHAFTFLPAAYGKGVIVMNSCDGLYIGVDGCRGGWIACILDHGEFRTERYDSVELLVKQYPEFDAFLIDMAIGLPSSADQLRPDDLARKELRPRTSSVFPIPCRQAVYAETEEEQKKENYQILGKSLAKQSIAIIPKIRELDEFLNSHPAVWGIRWILRIWSCFSVPTRPGLSLARISA